MSIDDEITPEREAADTAELVGMVDVVTPEDERFSQQHSRLVSPDQDAFYDIVRTSDGVRQLTTLTDAERGEYEISEGGDLIDLQVVPHEKAKPGTARKIIDGLKPSTRFMTSNIEGGHDSVLGGRLITEHPNDQPFADAPEDEPLADAA